MWLPAMGVIEAAVELFFEAIAAVIRFVVGLPWLPARLRERRRLRREAEERRRAELTASEQREAARNALVGRRGVVVRPLKKFGVIQVDDTMHDAVSDLGFVEVGATVKIVGIEGQTYRVRLDEAPLQTAD